MQLYVVVTSFGLTVIQILLIIFNFLYFTNFMVFLKKRSGLQVQNENDPHLANVTPQIVEQTSQNSKFENKLLDGKNYFPIKLPSNDIASKYFPAVYCFASLKNIVWILINNQFYAQSSLHNFFSVLDYFWYNKKPFVTADTTAQFFF